MKDEEYIARAIEGCVVETLIPQDIFNNAKAIIGSRKEK